MKIIIYKAYHYWFTIVSANNKTVATSETYTRKHSAIRTASHFGLDIIDKTK